jgi:hypothetical protein
MKRFVFSNKYEVTLPNGSIKTLANAKEYVIWGREELRTKHETDPVFEDIDKPDPLNTTAYSKHKTIMELQTILKAREKIIADLREKGKRVVADRDGWEAVAKKLETEIARMKAGAGPTSDVDGELFRELKNALAKMFHPDALRSASNFERVVREELYKEINAEISRIEGKGRRS